MKITIVCDVLGEANNGTTLATLNLINYLTEKGHDVTVVSPDKSTKNKKNYYVVPTLNLGKFLNRVLERNGVQLAKADDELVKAAIKDADVVHVQVPLLLGVSAVRLALEMDKPITASFHCQAENVTAHLGLMNFTPANNLAYKIFYKNVFRHCDAVHYPTQFIKETFESHTAPTNAFVISNGVNDVFFTKGEAIKKDKFTIVCTGRYSKEKAQYQLIKAVAKSAHKSDIKIVLAGDGPFKARLRRLADKLGVDCDMQFFSREDLLKTLRGADLYVHTALIEIEAIACLEAIACGLVPVICNSPRSATRFFAINELNLFAPKDLNELSMLIDFWYENPDLKSEYAERYASKKNEYSQRACMAQMEEMLLSAIENHKKK